MVLGKKKFLVFFVLSRLGLFRNEARIMFLKFFTIFWKCSNLGQVETVPRTIFFFNLYFGLSRPDLARNEAKMTFFNFLNYFTIFFLNFFGNAHVG